MPKKHPQELDINDWQSLREGETLRVTCSHWKCQGKPNAFTITRTLDGCVYNCYRCETNGAIFMSSSPAAAMKKLKELRDVRHNNNRSANNIMGVLLPHDFINMVTHDKSIPPQAYAWVYKYELTDDDIFKYNIGYSQHIQRVVIPIYDVIRLYNGLAGIKLVAWQGRDVFYERNTKLYNKGILKRSPMKYYIEANTKYYQLNNYLINYNKLKSKKIIKSNKLYYKIISKSKSNKLIIIVEDILSCIKCYNKYKCDVVALLNSTITNQLVELLKDYPQVVVWLDWDARVKAIKASRQLQSQGVCAKTIRTLLDPKEVPYKEMPVL